MRRVFAAACVLTLGLGVGACASSGTETGQTTAMTVNAVCPMSGNTCDGNTSTSFQGKSVGFCCKNCVADWNKMTDTQRQSKLSTAMAGHP